MVRMTLVAIVAGLAWASPGAWADAPKTGANPAAHPIQKVKSERLPNCLRLTDKVLSGGEPDGEAAFAELRALGVRTIVSVDGAKPDVRAAKKHGLRYVHLPHGYDGIADERLMELAKAVRDLPGPIYVHCHHGKHRSPAAAAAACVSIGMLGTDDALAVLKIAGTSANYRGLYATVAAARQLDGAVLDRLKVEFPETANVPPLADAMVGIEHIHDRLKKFAAADWKVLPDQPDLDPPHETLLLKEQFAELLRTEMVAKQPPKFVALAQASDRAAGELETVLRLKPVDVKHASAVFGKITNNCQTCHQAFRDVPLGEKGGSAASPR